MAVSSSRDVVLGIASGYDARELAPFVRSLRATGYAGECVLFVDDLGPGAAALLDRHDVRAVPYFSMRSSLTWLFRAGGSISRHRASQIAGASAYLSVPGARLLETTDLPREGPVGAIFRRLVPLGATLMRHFLVDDWLRGPGAGAGAERAVLVDVRDVFFQASPFTDAPPGGAAAPFEIAEEPLPIGRSDTTFRFLRRRYGAATARRLRARPVLCCGVMRAGRDALRSVLRRVSAEVIRTALAGTVSGDQAIVNRLVYEELLPRATPPVAIWPLGNAWVAHLLPERVPTTRVGEDGVVRSLDGRPTAVVHFYDRHPALLASVRDRYGR